MVKQLSLASVISMRAILSPALLESARADSLGTFYQQRSKALNYNYNNASASEEPCTCGNGKAKIWGPGGPHTALLPVAELFNAQSDSEVEICYGPESTWRERATECAAGFMTAAEQQAAGFVRVYEDILDTGAGGYGSVGTPITMHRAVLLVPAGNPQGLTSFDDLLDRDDVGVVIVDGNYHGTLTSGTALWEDVVGRTGQLEDTASIRERVCHVASGAGDARDHLIDAEGTGCDAWIYWEDWAVANPSLIESIELPPELEIFRALTVMSTTNAGGDVVKSFIDFALTSDEAEDAMEAAGWYRSFDV